MQSAIDLVNEKGSSWGVDVMNISVEFCEPETIRNMLREDLFFAEAASHFDHTILCIRDLESRSRGSSTLAVNEWVLGSDGHADRVMLVQRIIHMQDQRKALILVEASVWNVPIAPVMGDAGLVRVSKDQYRPELFLSATFEESQMQWSELHLTVIGDQLVFRGLV